MVTLNFRSTYITNRLRLWRAVPYEFAEKVCH